MGLEEYRGVYVFAQQVDNELSGIAFELLGKAKDLAYRRPAVFPCDGRPIHCRTLDRYESFPATRVRGERHRIERIGHNESDIRHGADRARIGADH